jgi:hypothetical protein
MISNWGVKYTIGKVFLRVIKYCPCMLQKCLFEEDMSIQSFWTTRVPILGLSLGSLKIKMPFQCNPHGNS